MLSGLIEIFVKIYIFIIVFNWIGTHIRNYRRWEFGKILNQAAEFTLSPVRKLLVPITQPFFDFDLSPLVAIIILEVFLILW